MTSSQVSLVLQGVIPVGVSAMVESSTDLSIAKPLQIALSLAPITLAYLLTRRLNLPIARMSIIMTVSIFIASIYWELLSFASALTPYVHTAIFISIALITQYLLTRIGKSLIGADPGINE